MDPILVAHLADENVDHSLCPDLEMGLSHAGGITWESGERGGWMEQERGGRSSAGVLQMAAAGDDGDRSHWYGGEGLLWEWTKFHVRGPNNWIGGA